MTLKPTRNLGMLLLAVWLILTGLVALFDVTFEGIGIVMGLFALLAGVLILLGR